MLQHRNNMLYGFAQANAQTKYAEPTVLYTTLKHSSSRAGPKEILTSTFLSLVQKFIFFCA